MRTVRHRTNSTIAMTTILMCIALSNTAASAGPGTKDRPDIFDRTANGNQQIADALIEAKRDHKRVLLKFGANWCSWCHLLHDVFKNEKDIAKELQYEYVVVHVDVDQVDGKQHNADVVERYGNPVKLGLPVLVVLDAEGKQLTTQETGSLEDGDHHNPDRVLAFLKQWRATPPSAETALSEGLATASKRSKHALVVFSAPWCGWCRRLDDFLALPEVDRVIGSAFVTVKVDEDRYAGGKEMKARHGGGDAGLPFFVILDPTGRRVADSIADGIGNVGFPATAEETAHFGRMLRGVAPSLGDADMAVIQQGLAKMKPNTN